MGREERARSGAGRGAARLRIGIPVGLHYFRFGRAWARFLGLLGHQVVVERPRGGMGAAADLRAGVSEMCLPVKLYLARCVELAGRVDRLLVPRLVSIEPEAYMCPLFLGLPDMVRTALPPGAELLAPRVHVKHGVLHREALLDLARSLGHGRAEAEAAWALAFESPVVGRPAGTPGAGGRGRPRILLAAHDYILGDPQLHMDVAGRLEALGAEVALSSELRSALGDEALGELDPAIYWTSSREVIAAGVQALRDPAFAGVVALACFGCGPDSLGLSLLEAEARAPGRNPFMAFVLDEHLSAVGLQSRLDAFWDMVEARMREGGRSCALH